MSSSVRPAKASLTISALIVAALWAAGCAPIPHPEVLNQVDSVRQATATLEARKHAPTAYAKAEKLRHEARAAFANDDLAGSQIIAEQALAAYAEAVALARIVRAEGQRVGLAADATAAEKRLAALDVEHQKVAADIAALQGQLRVLRDAEPIQSSPAAKGDRERARGQAVKTLQLQARLLCVAGRLLTQSRGGTPPKELTDAASALAELDEWLARGPAAAPIDQATRARAACLRGLTVVRRADPDPAQATGADDALLTALSKAGYGRPLRDDRGVVVTLRDLFAGDAIGTAGAKALAAVAEVAKQHKSFPIMVVLHQRRPLDPRTEKRWRARGAALVAALKQQLGDRPVSPAQVAGAAAPLVDPQGPYSHRNERVDIVFITPRSL
ncbi:MAG: hypothetical protein DRI90_13860 [Deltaproteobacteria bacterium]|nr:MAG: hypothetical protein DRI90_13860 [Deltaproteobacteria bacterium]